MTYSDFLKWLVKTEPRDSLNFLTRMTALFEEFAASLKSGDVRKDSVDSFKTTEQSKTDALRGTKNQSLTVTAEELGLEGQINVVLASGALLPVADIRKVYAFLEANPEFYRFVR